MYTIIILPVVLHIYETWWLILREERTLMVFDHRVLMRTFRPKKDKVKGTGGNYILRILMICSPHQILFG
jgi:hypothetical protein